MKTDWLTGSAQTTSTAATLHKNNTFTNTSALYVFIRVPSLSPPGVRALLSPGQVFLLAVIDTSSRTLSARAPSMPRGRRSTRTRWLSVPPERRNDYDKYSVLSNGEKNSLPSPLKTFIQTITKFHHFLLIFFSVQLSSEVSKLFQSHEKRMQIRKD